MRLIKRDQKPIILRERILVKDLDGTSYDGWGEESITLQGNLQPLSGRLAAEMYGERLKYMKVVYVEATPNVLSFVDHFNLSSKGYGAHVYNTESPDYKVVSAKAWRHVVIELEVI